MWGKMVSEGFKGISEFELTDLVLWFFELCFVWWNQMVMCLKKMHSHINAFNKVAIYINELIQDPGSNSGMHRQI